MFSVYVFLLLSSLGELRAYWQCQCPPFAGLLPLSPSPAWEGLDVGYRVWVLAACCALHALGKDRRCSGQLAWKWLKLLRTQMLLCSSTKFYRNHKSRLACRGTRQYSHKYVPRLSGSAVCSPLAADSVTLLQKQSEPKKQILAAS